MYFCVYSYWLLLGKCEIVLVFCRIFEIKRKLFIYIYYFLFRLKFIVMDLLVKINVYS